MIKKVLAGAVVAASLSTGAVASDNGFYLVADVGYGEAKDMGATRADLDAEFTSLFNAFGVAVLDGKSSLDDSDTTFRVGGGYGFNEFFAVELSYADLGEVGYKASGVLTDGFEFANGRLSAIVETQGIELAVVGSYPITERFSVYSKGGVFFSDMEATVRLSADGLSSSESVDDDDEDYLLGLGVQYALTDAWAVTADFTRIFDVGGEDIGETDYDRITVGVKYHF